MLALENLNKPSNKKLKAIADFFLYTLPLYQGAILTLPLSDKNKMWITFVISIIVISLKGLTKFTSEEPKQDVNPS